MAGTLAGFPDDAALWARWERLLARAPRLRPWLAQMIARERGLLSGSDAEPALRAAVLRWLRDFEALPQFAVAAIATELSEEPPVADDEPSPEAAPQAAESPDRAAALREALLADPLFALAFHCVDVAVRPALDLTRVPEPHWLGMLHASARPSVQLDAAAAVALVLRMLSASWTGQRAAALRLFLATPADLRASAELARLCAALPPEWQLAPADAPAFVAAAARARAGLAEAAALCDRLAGSAGGLRHLAPGDARATQGELAQVRASIRLHARIPGFRRLEALL